MPSLGVLVSRLFDETASRARNLHFMKQVTSANGGAVSKVSPRVPALSLARRVREIRNGTPAVEPAERLSCQDADNSWTVYNIVERNHPQLNERYQISLLSLLYLLILCGMRVFFIAKFNFFLTKLLTTNTWFLIFTGSLQYEHLQ